MRTRGDQMMVSLKAIAIGSAIFGITCLAALVVVTAVEGADTLSTVALALAILAFVVQIIVFIVQTTAANQQMLQGQALFGEMQGVLAQIREKAAGTEAAVTTINERLLGHVLGKALPQTASEEVDPLSPDFSQRLAENVVRLLDSKGTPEGDGERSAQTYPPATPDERLRRRLLTFPSPQAAKASMDALEKVRGALDLSRIQLLAEDALAAAGENAAFGPGLHLDKPDQLVRLGLVDVFPGYEDAKDTPLYTLTDDGHEAARILLAKGEAPEPIRERVDKVRDRYRRIKALLDEDDGQGEDEDDSGS